MFDVGGNKVEKPSLCRYVGKIDLAFICVGHRDIGTDCTPSDGQAASQPLWGSGQGITVIWSVRASEALKEKN